MKYAFKVTRNVKTNMVVVSNLFTVPDETDEYVSFEQGIVEVLHVHSDREAARASRSWEVVAAKFHHFTSRHLAEIMRADLVRARALGVSEPMLQKWLGFGNEYCSKAVAEQIAEARKTAKLHIFVGLLEQLIERAGNTLSDAMRPYARY